MISDQGRTVQDVRLPLYLLVSAPLIRNLVMYSAGFLDPQYSHRRDFLSELSAIGAPYQLVVSVLGPGLTGVALCFAAPVLWSTWNDSRFGRLAAAALLVSGVAYIGIALAPCDPGCSPASMGPRMIIHLVSGLVATGTLVLGGLAFGVSRLRSGNQEGLGWACVICGAIGIAAYALLYALLIGIGSALESPGSVQRIVQGAGDACLIMAALWTVGRLREPEAEGRHRAADGRR